MKGSVFDIVVLLSTFFLTVLVDLTIAIEIGVVLSAILFMKRMGDLGKTIPSRIDSDVIDDYSDVPAGIGIYEISGPLFFASAKQYCEVLKSIGLRKKVIIIRMRHVPFVDSTGLHNLKDTLKILSDSGTQVVLSGVNKSVCDSLNKSRIDILVGKSNIYSTFDQAMEGAKKRIK